MKENQTSFIDYECHTSSHGDIMEFLSLVIAGVTNEDHRQITQGIEQFSAMLDEHAAFYDTRDLHLAQTTLQSTQNTPNTIVT